MAYTYGQLETLWINAGGPKALAPLMAAIALAESGGNPGALNQTDNGGTQTSVGLWQVSSGTHQYPSAWATPAGNAAEAVAKYKSPGARRVGHVHVRRLSAVLQGRHPRLRAAPRRRDAAGHA